MSLSVFIAGIAIQTVAVTQNVRFMNLDWLKSHDISIDRSNYDLIYTAPLRESGTVPEQLEKLYEQFNLQKPADFHRDRKSTRLNSSHSGESRMPSSA